MIIVNDGQDKSKDSTTELSLKHQKFNGDKIDLKVVEYPKNKGKGGAVRTVNINIC